MTIKRKRLNCENLESRLLFSATDPNDQFSEASILQTNSSVPGMISAPTDVNLYRFTATAGQRIAFDINTRENGIGGLGSYLRLFNAAGSQLATNNDGQAPNDPQMRPGETHASKYFDSYLEYQFKTRGDYYLGVSNWQNTGYDPKTGLRDSQGSLHLTGDYTLSLSVVPPDPDDQRSEARLLQPTLSAPAIVRDAINRPTDVDMYRFTAAAGQRVAFNIDTPQNGIGGLGSYLRLFNAAGAQLNWNNDGQAPHESQPSPGETHQSQFFDSYLEHVFSQSGDYYIGVSNWQNMRYDLIGGEGDNSGELHLMGPYTLSVLIVKDLTMSNAMWASPLQNQEISSIVKVNVSSSGFSGSVNVRVYQSQDGQFDQFDRPLGPSKAVNVIAGKSTTVDVPVSSPPNRWSSMNFLVVVDPENRVAENNERNNAVALPVADSRELSYELETHTPMANRPLERVVLWLKRHRDLIKQEAALRHIPAEAIAGAIAWEAIVNTNPKTKLLGPGKVHPDDNNAAHHVEQMGYLPKESYPFDRWGRVRDTVWAIRYIGAIMGAYADSYDRVYAGVYGPSNVRDRPEILATLFHGISTPKVNLQQVKANVMVFPNPDKSGETFIRPLNSETYFQYKKQTGQSYLPNESMGAFVRSNLSTLSGALR